MKKNYSFTQSTVNYKAATTSFSCNNIVKPTLNNTTWCIDLQHTVVINLVLSNCKHSFLCNKSRKI